MGARSFLQRADLLAASPGEVSRIRQVEGPRGVATRATVYARYAGYILAILVCSALSQVMMATSGTTQLAGNATFGTATAMFLVAAIGTAVYPTQRTTIIEQLRHYLFGLMLFPSTGLAFVVWGITTIAMSPAATEDVMLRTLQFSMPIIWGCTLIIPLVIFVKVVAGVSTMHRSHLDDEEMVQLYTRMDRHHF